MQVESGWQSFDGCMKLAVVLPILWKGRNGFVASMAKFMIAKTNKKSEGHKRLDFAENKKDPKQKLKCFLTARDLDDAPFCRDTNHNGVHPRWMWRYGRHLKDTNQVPGWRVTCLLLRPTIEELSMEISETGHQAAYPAAPPARPFTSYGPRKG